MATAQDRSEDEKDARHRVKVRIGDEDYVLRGDASPAYIEMLARTVDEKFSELLNTYRNIPRHRLAILTALHLADEVHKLQQRAEQPARPSEEAD